MISPADIHNKVFKKGFRGYDEEEVDDFLDQIINDYEALFRENNQLKEELKLSEKKLDQFRDMEKNIRDTLLVAQKTADDVMGNAKARSEEMRVAAEKECANMKKQAEIEVRQKLENIEDQVRHKEDQYDNMLHRQRQFLIKIKALLRTELELLEEEGVQQTVGALGPDDPDEAEDMAAAEAEALRELAPDKAKEKESKAVPKVAVPNLKIPKRGDVATAETKPVVLPWQRGPQEMRGANGVVERDARVLAEKRREETKQGDKK
ncbi:MAG: DivIVA domain-containing protein [Selenomonadaceae bacterium]